MVASLHHNDVLLARGVPGQLEGGLGGLRARVGEEEGVQGRVGHDRVQLREEAHERVVVVDARLDVDALGGLCVVTRRGGEWELWV